MLTFIADSNIANLDDYFNAQVLDYPATVIKMAGRDITADVLAQYQPDALLIRSVTKVNEQLLTNNASVKFVGSATIGTDHVDQDYLASRHIAFANAAGCSKHSVAQYVMTAILSLRPDYWQRPIKLGIIGLGNIGSTLAQYAQDLGWQVLGYDPLIPSSIINNASLEQVLTQSNVISLHVPLTSAEQSTHPTRHLINEAAFAQMAAGTLLINTARGPVISEVALLDNLASSQREVVLDVFEHEPEVSETLLSQLAIATPHIAGYTLEGKLRGTQMVFEAFVETFSEQLQAVDPQLMDKLLPDNPYTWQELQSQSSKLADYYHIWEDDALLRNAVHQEAGQVQGSDFDALRKAYKLRREWIFGTV